MLKWQSEVAKGVPVMNHQTKHNITDKQREECWGEGTKEGL